MLNTCFNLHLFHLSDGEFAHRSSSTSIDREFTEHSTHNPQNVWVAVVNKYSHCSVPLIPAVLMVILSRSTIIHKLMNEQSFNSGTLAPNKNYTFNDVARRGLWNLHTYVYVYRRYSMLAYLKLAINILIVTLQNQRHNTEPHTELHSRIFLLNRGRTRLLQCSRTWQNSLCCMEYFSIFAQLNEKV